MAKQKPYTARSLSGAQRMVRDLLRQRKQLDDLAGRYKRERDLMAKLAADTPQFYNPIVVMEAKMLRDEILKGRR